jgi:hypothetical protein
MDIKILSIIKAQLRRFGYFIEYSCKITQVKINLIKPDKSRKITHNLRIVILD